MQFLNLNTKEAWPFIVGLLVIFLNIFAISYFGIGEAFPGIYKGIHFIGGFIVAWFFSQFWKEKLKTFTKLERVLLLMAMGALVGFFWEIAEISTSLPPLNKMGILNYYLYGGDLLDTLNDLAHDIFGATVFSLFLFRR